MGIAPATRPLGNWRKHNHGLTVQQVGPQRFQRELFANCRARSVKGATFEHCGFIECGFHPEHIIDTLGVTVTLDCFTFDGLYLNELAMDAMLYLLTLTKGNDEKRAALHRLIAPARAADFDGLFKRMENVRGL